MIMHRPQLELERLAPSSILKKLQDSLTSSEVKFESRMINPEFTDGSVVVRSAYDEDDGFDIVDHNPPLAESSVDTRNCPTYFYHPGMDVVVLPPASIGDDKLETLDELLEKIIAQDNDFVSSTVKDKNLVIPIAINSRFSKHFVTLYFNPPDQRITIYDSEPGSFWGDNFDYFLKGYGLLYTALKKHGIAKESATLEVKHLDLQNDSNSCGYWTGVLSVAIAKRGEQSAVEEKKRLQHEFLNDQKQTAIEKSEANLLDLLEQAFDENNLELMVKKALASRKNIYVNSDSAGRVPFSEDTDIALDDLIRGLNEGNFAIGVAFANRFLPADFFRDLPEDLSISQRVIFDAMFFHLMGDSQITPFLDMKANGLLHLIVDESSVQFDEIESYCIQCSKDIKDNLYNVYSKWLKVKLDANSALFRGNSKDWVNPPSVTVSVDEPKPSTKIKPTTRTSTQLAFASFKAAIKIMLLIALIILVTLLALYLASNPAVGIGLAVGAGVAGVGYGAYKFFKWRCKDKDDGGIQPYNTIKNVS